MGLNKRKNRKLNMEFVWIICIPIDTIDNTFGYIGFIHWRLQLCFL